MIPAVWSPLIAALNGFSERQDYADRLASCNAFEPADEADGRGECWTDGHYLCAECRHITLSVIRDRKGQCRRCGAAMREGLWGPECPMCV